MADVADHPAEPYGKRRQSMMPRDGPDGMTQGPYNRRMSRLEPRPSVQYGMARRMSHVSRSSMSGASLGLRDFKPTQVQNTYRMAPGNEERFQAKKAEEVIKQVLESFLEGEKYGPNIKNITTQIAEVINGRIKGLGFCDRYKFVCMVNIGQNRNQGIAVASRSVWNTETDNYAAASHSTQDLFAVASVFATYFE